MPNRAHEDSRPIHQQAGDLRLTVVMTSFNEVKLIERAYESARRIDVDSMELIIVDNGSTDGTQDILREIQKRDSISTFVLQEKNLSLAYSVELGIRMAKGRYTYFHHGDDEYDSAYARPMLDGAEADGLDMLLGSRLTHRAETAWQLVRERPGWLGSLITTGLINFWYGKHFTDIIGSRIYRTEAVRNDEITSYGSAFDFEIVSRLCKRGVKIEEMPIGYAPRECEADKKVRWYHLIPALWVMARVRYLERNP